MNNASVSTTILKMQKPGLAGWSVYPGTLMRSIDPGLALCQNYPLFIWAIDLFRTERQLPARFNSSGRREDVVVAVTLVELWAFNRWVFVVAIKDDRAFVK